MGGSVFAQGESGVRSADLDVFARVGYALADLVVHAGGGKIGEGAGEGDFPADGHAGGDADHVGFGDAYLEESVGMLGGEFVHFERTGQVGAQCDHIRVFIAQDGQRVAETAAGVVVAQYFVFFHVWCCLTWLD